MFDRFHVVKLLNDKLTQLRRELYRQATDDLHKQVLKGTRWLLLKNPENLDPVKGEPERLRRSPAPERVAGHGLLPQGRPAANLGTARQVPRADASSCDWYHQAMASGIRILQDFARTLLAHADGILA